MDILVDRFISDNDTTISRISIDGKFECFGLEDEFRQEKLAKETRIPAGKYRIGLRTVGGFHQKYTERFGKDKHFGMLHVLDVPNFQFILIHCGNNDEHTDGCLLVGASANTEPGNMFISNSAVAYTKLYAAVVDAARAEKLRIEYVDSDRA